MFGFWKRARRAEPKPGDVYTFEHSDVDPWHITKPVMATVVAVAKGYVRYRIGTSQTHDVKRISDFLACYSVGPIAPKIDKAV